MLIFHAFDRLPRKFNLQGNDFKPLREIYEQLKVSFLVVTRRPLNYLERANGLEKSQFLGNFNHIHRPGLLDDEESRVLISKAEWTKELSDLIVFWGGGNPYCLQVICCEIYQKIHIDGNGVYIDLAGLSNEIERSEDLCHYFDRLIESLSWDDLFNPLIQAVDGSHIDEPDKIKVLIDLNYLRSEKTKKNHQLFSPLFHNYLVDRDDLSKRVKINIFAHDVGPLPNEFEEQNTETDGLETTTNNTDYVHQGNIFSIDSLSPAEKRILPYLASALSYKAIGVELNLTESCIKSHVNSIADKLNIHGWERRRLIVDSVRRP